jgi:hypothetical protein
MQHAYQIQDHPETCKKAYRAGACKHCDDCAARRQAKVPNIKSKDWQAYAFAEKTESFAVVNA